MKIVFLVVNYMPHQLVSIKAILKTKGIEVHAFSYKAPHTFKEDIPNLITYKVSDFSRNSFYNKIITINPEFMVVAGWGIKDFVWVSKKIKAKFDIPVVAYSDTQWLATFKQKVNCLISPFHVKKAFTHLWVAGVYQYEYARRLGFDKTKIIYNALSCDMDLFRTVSLNHKVISYPKNFLFIGRFVPVKGLDLLVEAWNLINDKKGWSLTLIGDGVLKEELSKQDNIIIKNFLPQKELISEMEASGCFVLPSVFEQWSLVLHEASTAGLPIIATNACGAIPHFLINKFNGYTVNPTVESVKGALLQIINKDASELMEMSNNSRQLAESITPELGSAQLLSILN